MTTEQLRADGGRAGWPVPPTVEDLISADVGIAHRVDDGVTRYDHPRLAFCYALLSDTRAVLDTAQDARAGGVAAGPVRARSAALGEAIERYCGAYVPRERLRRAEADELRGPVVGPLWLDPSADHGAVDWVRGHRLHADRPAEPAWVAASQVYLSVPAEISSIAVPTSTGLACHPDPWQALYSGLMETIERDAFMVCWLTAGPATPLTGSLSWIEADGTPVRFDCGVETYSLYLLESPTGVPVVLAVARGARDQPPVAVGAAADLDLVIAARKALIEARQTFNWAEMLLIGGTRIPASPEELCDFDDHVTYYLDPSRLGAFDFLDAGTSPPLTLDLGAPAATITAEQRCRQALTMVEQAGFESFAVDVTAPDIRETGIWVVRSVIAGLYPLVVGHHLPDHPRVPRDVALARDPHPFP